MVKNLIIGGLLVVVLGFGYYLFGMRSSEPETPQLPETNEPEICIQVITPARNPETGEIREFPTPCDVPDGWEVIENDIPTLDLEVQ